MLPASIPIIKSNDKVVISSTNFKSNSTKHLKKNLERQREEPKREEKIQRTKRKRNK